MDRKHLSDTLRRYALFLAGLLVASMGVAFSTKAALGTSPVASVPYSISLVSSTSRSSPALALSSSKLSTLTSATHIFSDSYFSISR